MVSLVLLLDIALLLLPLSFIGGCKIDARAKPAIANPISTKPFMTGIRLTSFEGQQELFVLQIDSIELICKTLGSFHLEDQRDISANNCYLKSDSASLLGNIHEIEKFLFPMMKSLENQTSHTSTAIVNKKSDSYTERLVRIPPPLKASPFACAISQPQGRETIFQADLATFDPLQTDISLEGKVKVKGGNQTCLTAENIIWRVTPQELYVEGAYNFQTGGREIKGQDACFSLAGGELKPVKLGKTQNLLCPKELTSSAAIAPVMVSPGGNGFHSLKKKRIMSHLCRTLFQSMIATVAPVDQRLTSANNQRKEASFHYPKPNVYPPPPTTPYSAQETVDRELFAEKSLIKYYRR